MLSVFTSVDTLTPSQCAEVGATVHLLKSFWSQVNPPSDFYTLGVASYIEFCNPAGAHVEYYDKARRYNPVLKEYFGGLLENVRGTLERQLGEPVSYMEEFAIPGFHIWLTDAIPTRASASVHFDLQYQSLNWPSPGAVEYDKPVSFTLPIRLPERGGGINVWDVSYREIMSLSEQAVPVDVDTMRSARPQFQYEYSLGRLVMHSGHFLHQIAPVPEVRPGDERITLQGHALRCGGQWQVYW
ncbi:MAG TPA: hypothetical protein VF659_16115 [Pyrinomonadaceae bacterium]|jgi:hypothetical protein